MCSEQRFRRIDPVWYPGPVPKHFWEDRQNRRNYLLWLGHKLRLRRMADWYAVTAKSFVRNRGSAVLKRYYMSPAETVRSLFPQYDWHAWLFSRVPNGFWEVAANRRRFVAWLGRELGVRHWEDWYAVTNKDFVRHRGMTLLNRYGSSIPLLLSSLFPEHDWKPWLFEETPNNFWVSRANRRRYIDWLAEQLGIKKTEDWYRVTYADFERHRGGTLLAVFEPGSVLAAVRDAFPDYPWEPWRFKTAEKGFWTVRGNRLRYMRWLGRILGFRGPKDWYRITNDDFLRHFGRTCLKHYGGSAVRAAMDLYPEYSWKEWLFRQAPQGFWDQPENRRRYLYWLGKQLGFRRPEDWHRIRRRDLANNHGSWFVNRGRSPWKFLREYLPEIDWSDRRRPPLDIPQVLEWADTYFAEHRKWPIAVSGPISDSKETWYAIDRALQRGLRGLSGHSSLAQLLEKHRGVARWSTQVKLSEVQILEWADAYYARHGKWPRPLPEQIPGTQETWSRIDDSLYRGGRGLPGGTTLLLLLKKGRGVRHRMYH